MNVVDSSGWLEYFAEGANARHFASPIEDVKRLIVPTISIAEVFKRVILQRGEATALIAVALMQQGRVVDLTSSIAIDAARIGVEERIPLADSLILATARATNAVLWTQDSDFKNVRGVRFFPAAKK